MAKKATTEATTTETAVNAEATPVTETVATEATATTDSAPATEAEATTTETAVNAEATTEAASVTETAATEATATEVISMDSQLKAEQARVVSIPEAPPHHTAIVAASMVPGKTYVNKEGTRLRVIGDRLTTTRVVKEVPIFGMMEASVEDIEGELTVLE